jgi:hypothetical protein
MTIICYRDGILAADSAVWQGDTIAGHREKIRIPEGDEWDVFGIILDKDGPMYIDRALHACQLQAPFMAIGRGEDFAMGAMAAGAGAEEAVRLCIANLAFCAGDVQREWLEPERGTDGLLTKEWTTKVLDAILGFCEYGPESAEPLDLSPYLDSNNGPDRVTLDVWLTKAAATATPQYFISRNAIRIATFLRRALPPGKKFTSRYIELPCGLDLCQFQAKDTISGRLIVTWAHVGFEETGVALEEREIYDVARDENVVGPAGIRFRIDIPTTDI